jgi:hypothetical protein
MVLVLNENLNFIRIIDYFRIMDLILVFSMEMYLYEISLNDLMILMVNFIRNSSNEYYVLD